MITAKSRYRIPSHPSTELVSSDDTESSTTTRSRRRDRIQPFSTVAEKPKKASAPKRPIIKQAFEELESVKKTTQQLRQQNFHNTESIARPTVALSSKGRGTHHRSRRFYISLSSGRSTAHRSSSAESSQRLNVFERLSDQKSVPIRFRCR